MTTKITAPMLQSFLSEELLNGASVSADEDLLLSGLLDSLGVMALVSFIEKTQAAPVPAGDITIENFSSVDTIVTYLNNG